MYSPLRAEQTNYRVDYRLTLNLKDWCSKELPAGTPKGVIKVGDFNGDKKDDVLCIEGSNFYLLYSNGANFRPASTSPDGKITIGTSISGHGFQTASISDWRSDKKIVVGDFDGDGYADIARLESTTIDVLYGHPDSIFVTRTDTKWSSSIASTLSKCTDINKIIIADTNGDGKDDINCIDKDTIVDVKSEIPSQTIIQEEGGSIKFFVEDVQLDKSLASQNIQKSLCSDEYTCKNIDNTGTLVSLTNKMQHLKAVTDVSFPIYSANLAEHNHAESFFSFSSTYEIPENILWDQGSSMNKKSVKIDFSAHQKNGVIDLNSNILQTFEQTVEASNVGCYTSTPTTHLISLTIGYKANIKMVVERDNRVLFGTQLEEETEKILESYTIEDGAATFPAEGHITVNLLGVGYNTLEHCSQNTQGDTNG